MLTAKTTGNPNAQLALLRLDRNKRRRVLRSAGRKVRRDSRANLRDQSGIDGRRWKGRVNGGKKRMLKKIGKHLQVQTSDQNVNVTFGNTRVGKVARVHQEGIKQTMTADEAAKIYDSPGDDSATRRQARALREEGYKVRKNKRYKQPSIRWIVENLSKSQAGLILRTLRSSESKKRWDIHTPQRDFLGQNLEQEIELKNLMLSEAVRISR